MDIKIKKAKPSGFCFGVKRAITIADNTLKRKTKLYSLGPIIHNPLVVRELSDKGMRVIYDIKDAIGAKVLIRSHGVSPSIIKKIKKNRIGIIDATCPFVARSHRIVSNLKKEGFYIIIVGEKKHPEVVALAEAAGGDKQVVLDVSQVKKFNLKNKKIGLLAQSTLTRSLFEKIAISILQKNPSELRIFDTLCKDVAKRQHEVAKLSKSVDLMLVVGGRISANTKRLLELCRSEGVKAYHLETERDIRREWFRDSKSVGVISGSSTPDYIVDRVIKYIRQL